MGEEVTATVTYKLWENVLSRAEIRWDHAGVQSWDTNSLQELFLRAKLAGTRTPFCWRLT